MQLVGKMAHTQTDGEKASKRTKRERNKSLRKKSYQHIMVRRNCQTDRPIAVAQKLMAGPGYSLFLHFVLPRGFLPVDGVRARHSLPHLTVM